MKALSLNLDLTTTKSRVRMTGAFLDAIYHHQEEAGYN